MLSKARIKLIRSLSQNKFRKSHELFIAEGWKIVREILAEKPEKIHSLYITGSGLELIREELPEQIDYEVIDQKELKQISLQKTPRDILALVSHFKEEWDPGLIQEGYSLVLDRIQDPGNLGTIIRIADWFGIGTIICSMDSADLYNPKSIQASMGSFLRVKVFYRKLTELLTEFSKKAGSGGGTGFGIYGTVLEGISIHDEPFKDKGFIILGNESKGISGELLPFIEHKLMIPSRWGSRGPDSLNVAAAAAIVCSELTRNESRA